ncbi:MAG: DegT/DnrJ/EryC1/StrS family aminotransferase [bacterium]|nr:DegT/DnrJ/EryC1/StrS family aminotransferase [bacterium]
MIPFFDYRPGHRAARDRIDAAIREVLDSGRLILGPQVAAFEREFAAFCGASEAVGVASGTDALALALRALEVGAGDEVITVANAGVPPVAAIRSLGAIPRFVDVDPDTLLIDAAALEAVVGDRTRCIVPVHLYGRAVPMAGVLQFAERHGLTVVEDCAQGHGAADAGRSVGSIGAIGCFSFYPTKNLGAYGDGGACVTSNGELAERLRQLRMYGFDERRHSRIEGLNSRLDELQAAILRVLLTELSSSVAERRRLAGLYHAALAGTGQALAPPADATAHAYHLFVVRVRERERYVAALDAEGIGHGIHYAEPVHEMDAYRRFDWARGSLPVTERACREVLSLPLYPGLAEDQVTRVARCVAAVR